MRDDNWKGKGRVQINKRNTRDLRLAGAYLVNVHSTSGDVVLNMFQRLGGDLGSDRARKLNGHNGSKANYRQQYGSH